MSNSLNVVCVAVDDKYDNSMGAYQVGYYYDGEKVFKKGGVYSDSIHTKNATVEEVYSASKVYMLNCEESYNYNKYLYSGRGGNTYIGCIVTLKGSRKAPNKTPLKVVDFSEAVYNGQYRTTEQICVETENGSVWVSSNCIDNVIKGVKEKPFWYISDDDYIKHLISEQKNKRSIMLELIMSGEVDEHNLNDYRLKHGILNDSELKELKSKLV